MALGHAGHAEPAAGVDHLAVGAEFGGKIARALGGDRGDAVALDQQVAGKRLRAGCVEDARVRDQDPGQVLLLSQWRPPHRGRRSTVGCGYDHKWRNS